MALGLTQPLTEMNTTNLPRGKARPTREADIHSTICEPTVRKTWAPRRLITLICLHGLLSRTALLLLLDTYSNERCDGVSKIILQNMLCSIWKYSRRIRTFLYLLNLFTLWSINLIRKTKSLGLYFATIYHYVKPRRKTSGVERLLRWQSGVFEPSSFQKRFFNNTTVNTQPLIMIQCF
jgi:hypothetical protein